LRQGRIELIVLRGRILLRRVEFRPQLPAIALLVSAGIASSTYLIASQGSTACIRSREPRAFARHRPDSTTVGATCPRDSRYVWRKIARAGILKAERVDSLFIHVWKGEHRWATVTGSAAKRKSLSNRRSPSRQLEHPDNGRWHARCGRGSKKLMRRNSETRAWLHR